jgi:hypothetical protein
VRKEKEMMEKEKSGKFVTAIQCYINMTEVCQQHNILINCMARSKFGYTRRITIKIPTYHSPTK